MNTMIVLGSYGDIEVVWDSEAHTQVIKVVAKMMECGYTFFELEDTRANLTTVHNKMKFTVDDDTYDVFSNAISHTNPVSVCGENQRKVRQSSQKNINKEHFVKELIVNGAAVTTNRSTRSTFNTIRKIKSPEEVVKSQNTMAVKPIAGG